MSAPTATGELREMLAKMCHEQWAGWMEYLFNKGQFDDQAGTWTMPVEYVERWQRQLGTSYGQLSEPEKDSDRREADKFLTVFFEYQRLSRLAMAEYILAKMEQRAADDQAPL